MLERSAWHTGGRVSIGEGMNLEDKEGGPGEAKSSEESQETWKDGVSAEMSLSERSPSTLDVQQHSVGPLENLPRLAPPWCLSPDYTFIVYLSIYC